MIQAKTAGLPAHLFPRRAAGAHDVTGLGIRPIASGNGELGFDPAVGGAHPAVARDQREDPNDVPVRPLEAPHDAGLISAVVELGKPRQHPIAGRGRR